jgi:hypothetical protein
MKMKLKLALNFPKKKKKKICCSAAAAAADTLAGATTLSWTALCLTTLDSVTPSIMTFWITTVSDILA